MRHWNGPDIFARDRGRRGANGAEYGLLAALIAVSLIVALTIVGTSTFDLYKRTGKALVGAEDAGDGSHRDQVLTQSFTNFSGGDGLMSYDEYKKAISDIRDMDPNDDLDMSWGTEQKTKFYDPAHGGYGYGDTITEDQFKGLFD